MESDSKPGLSAEVAADPPHGPKLWRAGTLTYTTGGLIILFFWLLWGDFAWSIKERSASQMVMLMLKKFEASDLLTGILIGSLPPAIAIFLGPIISYKSDRHRGRWGRRIPFLLIPTPIAVIAMTGLAFSPVFGVWLHGVLGAHSPGANTLVLFSFALFWMLFDFASITANSILGALINDVVPREVLGRFFGAFRALSLIAAMIFNYWLLGKVEAYHVWMFLGIGALFGVGFTLMCLNVREGEYPPAPVENGGGAGGFFPAMCGFLRDCFGKPYYILAFVTLAVPAIAFLPINLFSIFFAKSLKIPMDALGKWTATMFLVSLVLSYPLGVLADRVHPLRLGIATLVLYALAVLWGGLFICDPTSFFAAYLAHGILSGVWVTATASLGQRLFPREKFAQFASAAGIINCVSQIVIGPALGVFLDATGHVYRHTYLVGCGLAVICLFCAIKLHSRFQALGGPRNYVAPQ
ncbi:MAG: MFS transporter [Verrucomicrobiota bacterium]